MPPNRLMFYRRYSMVKFPAPQHVNTYPSTAFYQLIRRMIAIPYSRKHPMLPANAAARASVTDDLLHTYTNTQSDPASLRCLAPKEPAYSSPLFLHPGSEGPRCHKPLTHIQSPTTTLDAISAHPSAVPSGSLVDPQYTRDTRDQEGTQASDITEETLSDDERRDYEFRITKLERDLRAETAYVELLRRQRHELMATLAAYNHDGGGVLVARAFTWEVPGEQAWARMG